jgi:hypothetical protein
MHGTIEILIGKLLKHISAFDMRVSTGLTAMLIVVTLIAVAADHTTRMDLIYWLRLACC